MIDRNDPSPDVWRGFTGASDDLGGSNRFWRAAQRASLQLARPVSWALGPLHDRAFGILIYHRIVDELPDDALPSVNVRPLQLKRQLEGLLSMGYEAWPLSRVLEHHMSGEEIPRKTFVVTFDDGFENNYFEAWPILCELRIPATIFLATAYLESRSPFPFYDLSKSNREVNAASWRPLTKSQCHEMLESGFIELGAHTHTHQDFRGRPREFAEDLSKCVEQLQAEFALQEVTFAFPQGRKSPGFVSPELVSAAQESGVICALNTENELVRPADDPFDWGRFSVSDHDTSSTITARLDGWYLKGRDTLRSLRR